MTRAYESRWGAHSAPTDRLASGEEIAAPSPRTLPPLSAFGLAPNKKILGFPLIRVPYLSASAVVIHYEEALY